MSGRNVVYLPDAVQDLHGIWAFIADQSRSVDVADRLIDAIDDAAMLYATNPEIGTVRPDLAAGIRYFTVGRYVVFYLTTTHGIEIMQVIHGARDIPVHFRRSSSH